MTAPESTYPPRLTFLDDDHVIRLIRALLAGPQSADSPYVAEFFYPERLKESEWANLTQGLGAYRDAPDALSGAVENSEVILFRRGQIDADIFDRNPNLKLIQRLGSSSHMINLAAARDRGIAVSCIVRPSLVTVAEHCLMLMLAASRRLLPCDGAVRSGAYPAGQTGDIAYNWPGMTGIESLYGKTLGILGMGEVGTLLAERARAMGMDILYCDDTALPTALDQALSAKRVSTDVLFAQADVVSIHIPGTPNNRSAVAAAEIGKMKLGAILVNTSRGSIVDEEALASALESRRISAAALDVHGCEPRGMDRITASPNVVLTPHLAAGSRLTVLRDVEMIFDNLRATLSGSRIPHFPIVEGKAR